ncbi:hypothetical protein SNOG_10720 [Parastagonospora nodorum SN15]|uniref:Uncharacterized protein n=1 Tax=Phaeosphaeria nodorum (strain SN15 / ATCC MYA-4574 / FGSC 10173) TaxID=321614 RepID=Q0UBZ4_PHANO|nr:hypothetical protein SNOG_10720 [Parastagonospora nodorum SN15]EAT82114.1 hypothetical protein SNOG_10720 [Parastagonospora nodorum SN15]
MSQANSAVMGVGRDDDLLRKSGIMKFCLTHLRPSDKAFNRNTGPNEKAQVAYEL